MRHREVVLNCDYHLGHLQKLQVTKAAALFPHHLPMLLDINHYQIVLNMKLKIANRQILLMKNILTFLLF